MTPEAKVLKRAKATAKALGLRTIRMSMGPGVEAGWPDLFIMGPNRHLLGMETKRAGKTATPLQQERGREMCAYGFAWAKCDTPDDADFTLVNFARYCMGEPPMSREEVQKLNLTVH